jgi:purine-nucleoside phosphorylase
LETIVNYESAVEAAEFIRSKYTREVKLALVLGSGLGAFAEEIDNAVSIPYSQIPYFEQSTVEGHAGQLVLGEVEGVPVAVQQGRFHYYEGYDMQQVMFPMRTFGVMGIKGVVLTNAAGSLNTDLPQGSLMLIRDHLNMMGVNPLRGPNDKRFGVRFPDMTEVYDRGFQAVAAEEAAGIATERGEKNILGSGVYCALSGPTYETPSEIEMYRSFGADAVGMSTVPEAIAARHQGMKVLGISCITNLAAGMSDEPINHEEVMETGEKVSEVFKLLLRRIIPRIA